MELAQLMVSREQRDNNPDDNPQTEYADNGSQRLEDSGNVENKLVIHLNPDSTANPPSVHSDILHHSDADDNTEGETTSNDLGSLRMISDFDQNLEWEDQIENIVSSNFF